MPTRKILAYDVSPSGDKLSNKRVFVDAGPGTPDGFRVDIDGNLWCGWGMGDPELDGVVVFAPDGVMIGRIALPERCANLCFGGLKRNRLFMAASQSIYALYVNTQGALGRLGPRAPRACQVHPFFSCAAAVCLASASSNAFSSVAA